MFRFLIAFGAVCLFSVASAGVAEAGGGGGDGAGGGKGGGKGGSIEITNAGPSSITVYYRAEEDGSPATFGELNAFPKVELEPGATDSITGLDEGPYELAAVNTALTILATDAQPIPSKDSSDPGFRVVDVMDDSVTEVAVGDSSASFGDAEIISVNIMANE